MVKGRANPRAYRGHAQGRILGNSRVYQGQGREVQGTPGFVWIRTPTPCVKRDTRVVGLNVTPSRARVSRFFSATVHRSVQLVSVINKLQSYNGFLDHVAAQDRARVGTTGRSNLRATRPRLSLSTLRRIPSAAIGIKGFLSQHICQINIAVNFFCGINGFVRNNLPVRFGPTFFVYPIQQWPCHGPRFSVLRTDVINP